MNLQAIYVGAAHTLGELGTSRGKFLEQELSFRIEVVHGSMEVLPAVAHTNYVWQRVHQSTAD